MLDDGHHHQPQQPPSPRSDAPTLISAGSSSVTLRWRVPVETKVEDIKAEWRPSGWILAGAWRQVTLSTDDISIQPRTASSSSLCEEVEELPPYAVTVTLRGLEPLGSYDVRLDVGGFKKSTPRRCQTLAVAPPLHAAPRLKCARYDRLLLKWASPSSQVDEVTSYIVRFFDTEPRWPVKHEIEVKLASRLLKPSAQTAKFLEGSVAMLISTAVEEESDPLDDEPVRSASCEDCQEVHFWLTGLAASRMYYVQVAAKTASGQGEWSPKSDPLFTWRRAPKLAAPKLLFPSHGSLVFGLAYESLEEPSKGQDEEVEHFEMQLQPSQRGYEVQNLEFSSSDASMLATTLRPHLHLDDEVFPSHVVIASGLTSRSGYSCTALAITHAGRGEISQITRAETLAVPPAIADVKVEQVDHNSATISWRLSERTDIQELMKICMPDSTEFQERQLRGFRIRICYEPELETTGSGIRAQPLWTEILGARAAATASEKPGYYSLKVRELRPSSTCLVQVAAVAVGPGDGEWSDSAQICTEALAPELRGRLDVEMSFRQSAKLKWVTPKDIAGSPVHAYMVYLGRARDRGRSAVREFELPLQAVSAGTAEAVEMGSIWKHEGSITYMELRMLEPGTAYTVQVAAVTLRGLGERSEPCNFTTRSVAPSMGAILPRVVHSYHDHLVLECSGPVPDWSRSESSDVTGFSARYFECSRYGYAPHGAWIIVEKVDLVEEKGSTDLIRFSLKALQPERQYIVQVAAVTAAGKGPWSEQSARLSTWRVAPRLAAPIAVMHTHDTLVLGWDGEVLDDTLSSAVHDENINEFMVKVAPAGKAVQARTLRVSFNQAVSSAQAWREAGASDGTDGGALICEGSVSSNFVAVVPGLSPNQRYMCQAAAVSAAGQGEWSAQSAEVLTLPVAPAVLGARVDEVQHDQIVVSWEHVQLRPGVPQSLCDKLGLTKSIEELHLCGYSLRSAAWTTWRGLSWSKHVNVEVDTVTMSEGGHFHYAVKDLEPEKNYVVEIRALSASGAGAWSRVSELPICTALVAQEPSAPELVYATAFALTFSFAGVEDDRLVAYEVRRHEGPWRSPSKPLRFDHQSLAVRVTSENRWVVTVDQLKKETTYTLQLRGVTAAGGVTKWSEKSEPMSTLADEHGHEVELSVGVNEESPAPLAAGPPDVGSAESVEDFSKKLESVLSFTIDQATAGVRLPSVRIPSVAEQAEELLHTHRNDRNAAVKAAARIEDDDTWRSKLPDFLIQQVPVVGCSTVLLRELWRNIRRCALVAHLYGHDTRSPETQALILTCLVPAGGGSPAVPAVPSGSGSASSQQGFVKPNAVGNPGSAAGLEDVVSSRRVALLVSRALAKETFVRATGFKTAGQVVGLLEVAGRLLASNTKDASTESAAALSSETDDTLVADATSPVQVSLVVFRPLSMDERPSVVIGLLALWLLPIFVSAARFVFNKVYPLMAQRMELPLAALVGVLLIMQVLGVLAVIWVQQNLENFLSIPATLVFVLYTLIPAISVCLATRSVLQGAHEAPFFALLGVFNLASGYLRWAGDLSDDAALDQQPIPRFAACREQVTRWREWLWIGLLIDFVLEEIMGRVCGLHALRLLGPPITSTQATLVEYRTLAFAVGLVAAQAQARALVLLQRRSVLLRLLGARKAFIGGITLLLMGAFAVVQQPRTMAFLREVSPTPWWCCMVLWLRQFGAIAGALLPLVLYTLVQPQSFGRLSVDTLVPLAVSAGCVAGYMFCQSFTALWQEKREHLESDYRVIFLFPHMSSQARQKASAAMRVTLKRGAEATKNTAAEWVATRAVRTGMDFFVRALSRRTALPMD
ncbi:unnamed protein product [Durusdinium trenchii]|uniref:Fibronectin type-III domain-containing protein n=2 Tax=Durusdinium trenchii TaxID=1381693 RepID=A0ABP0MS03_9DINO